jgi:hypothetical protein
MTMGIMDNLSRDDELQAQESPIRRLTGAPSLAAPQGDMQPSAARRLTGPIARAANLAPSPVAGNPMDDGSLPSSIQSVAQQASAPAAPRIAQMAAGDSAAGNGLGFVNPDNVTPSPIAALVTARSSSGPTSVSVAPDQQAAPRIAQRAPSVQQQLEALYAASNADNGIVSGGDRVTAPGMTATVQQPYRTGDGRDIDPNAPNMAEADRAAIDRYSTRNAQMRDLYSQSQQGNPLATAVQIIRPGSEVSYAVQAPDRMVELKAPAFAQYQAAFQQNPQLAQRSQMTEGGIMLDGSLAPPDVIGGGDAAVKRYAPGRAAKLD